MGYYVFTPQGWNSSSNTLITSTPTQREPHHSLIAFNPADGGNPYQLVLRADLLGQRHKLTHVCVCAEQEIWRVARFIFEDDSLIRLAQGGGRKGRRKQRGRGRGGLIDKRTEIVDEGRARWRVMDGRMNRWKDGGRGVFTRRRRYILVFEILAGARQRGWAQKYLQ